MGMGVRVVCAGSEVEEEDDEEGEERKRLYVASELCEDAEEEEECDDDDGDHHHHHNHHHHHHHHHHRVDILHRRVERSWISSTKVTSAQSQQLHESSSRPPTHFTDLPTLSMSTKTLPWLSIAGRCSPSTASVWSSPMARWRRRNARATTNRPAHALKLLGQLVALHLSSAKDHVVTTHTCTHTHTHKAIHT